jgi:hypothetical protein
LNLKSSLSWEENNLERDYNYLAYPDLENPFAPYCKGNENDKVNPRTCIIRNYCVDPGGLFFPGRYYK